MVQAFGSPAALFAAMPDGESALARILHGRAEEVGPADWRLHVALIDDLEPYPELCIHLGAVCAASVRLFGLQATCVEERCQRLGDDECSFRLRWDESADLGGQLQFARAELDVLRRRLELFQQSIGDIVSSDDLDSVLRRVVRIGARSTMAPVFLLALQSEAWTTRSLYAVGVDDDEAANVAARALAEPLEDTIVVEVTSARRHYGHLLAVGTPPALIASERPVLEAFARLAAAALDSAYALEEARRQADAARALLDLSTALGDIASPGELAVRVVHAMQAVMGCDGAAMLLVDGDMAQMAAHHGFDPDAGRVLDKVRIPVDSSADHGVRIHAIDDAPPALAEIMRVTGVVTLATSPVAIDGVVLGFLVAAVGDDPGRILHDPQLADRFAGLAGQAAVALRNGSAPRSHPPPVAARLVDRSAQPDPDHRSGRADVGPGAPQPQRLSGAVPRPRRVQGGQRHARPRRRRRAPAQCRCPPDHRGSIQRHGRAPRRGRVRGAHRRLVARRRPGGGGGAPARRAAQPLRARGPRPRLSS